MLVLVTAAAYCPSRVSRSLLGSRDTLKIRSASPSSVAHTFRPGKRLIRQSSRSEPAQVSRPNVPRSKDVTSRARRRSSLPNPPSSYIEIEPGYQAPLRRPEETRDAIARDAFVSRHCYGCEASLYCMDSAKYMICPYCRVISPLWSTSRGTPDYVYGVSMAFTTETLRRTTQDLNRFPHGYWN